MVIMEGNGRSRVVKGTTWLELHADEVTHLRVSVGILFTNLIAELTGDRFCRVRFDSEAQCEEFVNRDYFAHAVQEW